ncbi:hypothetical protein [Streptomyces sp. NBC_00696]|uniref:ApeA N-terminal domain 1-containing protein n=1 Tax=Streptomyces sp. NBC_00696 TaxID=2903672 RepID=UPI002E37B7B1|nr:hypothetical protein [Streptomyces sp. NBC_00696]
MTTEDTDDFEVRGQWWLPGNKGSKIPGTLKKSETHGAELHLIGALDSRIGEDGIYPRIHGLADGKPYTLEDCFRSFLRNGEAEKVRLQQIFRGAWYADNEEPDCDQVTTRPRYLTQWIGNQGVRSDYIPPNELGDGKNGKPVVILRATLQPKISRPLASGIIVNIHHGVTEKPHTGTEQKIIEWREINLTFPEKVSTSDALAHMSDAQDLISIATGRTAEYDSVRFFHPDVVFNISGTEHRERIDFFADWMARDTSKKPGVINPHQMFFTFDDLGGIKGFTDWMTAAERHRSTLGRVMASKYREGLLMEDRIFHRVAAIEAFARDRIGYKGVKLPGALQHCRELAGDEFTELVGDAEKWSQVIKSNRDDIGHHYGRRPNQGGAQKYVLAESAYWLFILCMLREADAPAAVFRKIKDHSEWAWLTPKVHAVVHAG